MAERPRSNEEYKFINPSEYLSVLSGNPLWYLDDKVYGLISGYALQSSEGKPEDWKQTKLEVIRMFAESLEDGTIILGERPDGFNDDDRWSKEYFGKNPKVEKDHPDTVVIHHTSTSPNASLAELEARHLLRLYVPEYKRGFPDYNGTHTPIASGHYRDGKQTFIGYHRLVRTGGTIERTLKDSYTGFHAGDYPMNCRSTGIAIVGDLSNNPPSSSALEAVASLIQNYAPERVLAHNEVLFRGEPIDTSCPGRQWQSWKSQLFIPRTT